MQEAFFIQVFAAPDEAAAGQAYQAIVDCLRREAGLNLSVYRGINRMDGTPTLVLIGGEKSFTPYQEAILAILANVNAKTIEVPREALTPIITRFLETRIEMMLQQKQVLERHYPLENET